jgi:hypothetical protein
MEKKPLVYLGDKFEVKSAGLEARGGCGQSRSSSHGLAELLPAHYL